MEQNELINKIEEKLESLESKKNVFDAIFYNTNEDLSNFLNDLNQEQAIFCIIEACKKAHQRGVYSLVESEVVSKSLRTLNSI